MSWNALATIGPYFTLADVPAERPAWRGVDGLLDDPAALGRMIDGVAARLGTADRMVGASILQQGWAARLTSILTGCRALGLVYPDLSAANLRCELGRAGPTGFAVAGHQQLDASAAWHRLSDGHLDPLHRALRAVVPIGDRLLWGNVASAWAGSLTVLSGQGLLDAAHRADPRAWPIPDDLAELGTWHDAAAGVRFRRTTCCLYDRVPGAGRCGDCSLDR